MSFFNSLPSLALINCGVSIGCDFAHQGVAQQSKRLMEDRESLGIVMKMKDQVLPDCNNKLKC